MNKQTLREVERAGYRTAKNGGSFDPADTTEAALALSRAETEAEREEIREAFHAGYNQCMMRTVNRSARRAANFMKMIQDLDR